VRERAKAVNVTVERAEGGGGQTPVKITTLRLSNFQSFGPELAAIDLDGLTCVRGPNGSG
jgi:hypothetical protein